MPIMSDDNFETLRRLYEELSDFYFDISEDETSQDEREKLNDACESIADVLFAHELPSRRFQ